MSEIDTRFFVQRGISVGDIPSVYCRFDDYHTDTRYESKLMRVASRRGKIFYSVSSVIGGGKTSFINNLLYESLKDEDFKSFLVKISLFSESGITDLKKFAQNLFYNLGRAIKKRKSRKC